MGVEFDYGKRRINTDLKVLLLFFVIILLIYFVRPVVLAFGITVILVYILHPVHEFIHPHVKEHHHATFLIFLLILVPFFIFSIFLISATVQQISDLITKPEIKETIEVSGMNIQDFLKSPLTELDFEKFQTILGGLAAFLTTIGNVFLQLFMAILLTSYILHKERSIKESFNSIRDQRTKDFIGHVNEGLKNIVYSMFLTSFATGIIAIVLYFLFGAPYPILLGILTGIVALIPILGAWLVYAPVSLYFITQGKILFGLGFLVACFVFISTIPDILIRPIAVSKQDTDTVLLLLGFIMGTLAFGPVGIILGPLIMIALEGFTKIFIFLQPDKSHTHKTQKRD
jgi:predicted PurR-regulated permease PerM